MLVWQIIIGSRHGSRDIDDQPLQPELNKKLRTPFTTHHVAREEAKRMSVGCQTPCPANAMDVCLQASWEIVVHDEGEAADVQSSCSHVGGHHDLC